MIKQYFTIQSYWDDAKEFLLSNPVKNNIVIGQCLGYRDKEKVLENVLLLTIFAQREIVFTAFKNREHILLYGEKYSENDLKSICEFLIEKEILPLGVIAEKKLAVDFSKIYSNNYSIEKTLIAHQLKELRDIDICNGKMKLCSIQDLDIVAKMVVNFILECNLPENSEYEKIKNDTLIRIEKNQLYAWIVEGQIVSICAKTVRNEYFSKISIVYTPLEYRKKGYAISCVWSLSKLILEKGQKTICLFTDKSNPTSNKIYKEIGFRSINEDYQIKF